MIQIERNWPFVLLAWAGGIVLSFFLVIQPTVETLDDRQETRATLEQEVATLRRRLENLEPLQRQLLSLRATAEVLETRLPEDQDIPDLLITIEQAALSSEVEIRSFTPQSVSVAPDYVEVPFGASLRARYFDLLRFLNFLRRSQRLIQVRNFNFKKETGDLFLIDMNLSTYTVEKEGGAR